MIPKLDLIVHFDLLCSLGEVCQPPIVLLGCRVALTELAHPLTELHVARRHLLPAKVEARAGLLIRLIVRIV